MHGTALRICQHVHLCVLPCSLLEFYDFPPRLGHTIDAHACWHLATVPLYAMFYDLLHREEAHLRKEEAQALSMRAHEE